MTTINTKFPNLNVDQHPCTKTPLLPFLTVKGKINSHHWSQGDQMKKSVDKNITCSEVCLGGKLSLFSGISQNSILKKSTLHKIQYQKNRLLREFNIRKMDSFAKFNFRKADSLQNSISEKRTLRKIQCTGMKVSTIF